MTLKELSIELNTSIDKIVELLRMIHNPIKKDPNVVITEYLIPYVRKHFNKNTSTRSGKQKDQKVKSSSKYSKKSITTKKSTTLKPKTHKVKKEPKHITKTKGIKGSERSQHPKKVSPYGLIKSYNEESAKLKPLIEFNNSQESYDWDKIRFGNGKIWYSTSFTLELIDSRSSIYYNYIKDLFKINKISFKINLFNESPISFKIPDKIFEFFELVNVVADLELKSLTKYKWVKLYSNTVNNITNLLLAINKDKTFYLTSLNSKHSDSHPIKCLYGLRNDLSGLNKTPDISFLFIWENTRNIFVIWETLEIWKSTIVFRLAKFDSRFMIYMNEIENIISMEYLTIRSRIKAGELKINGVEEIIRLYHDYEKPKDLSWKIRLDDLLQ